MKKTIAVFISAAGKGTRMKEITQNCPKPLIKVNGKPLIDYLLSFLLQEKMINHVYVIYGYLKNKWEIYTQNKKDIKISFLIDDNPLNLINSLFESTKLIKEDVIVVISGDIIFDFKIISAALKQHINSSSDISVALNKSPNNKYKHWNYIFSDEQIINVIPDNKATNIERYFFIINKEVIEQYTCNYTQNMGYTDEEFKSYSEYNKGWSCLIKRLIDCKKYNIKGIYFDKKVINVNNIDGLNEAKDFLSSTL